MTDHNKTTGQAKHGTAARVAAGASLFFVVIGAVLTFVGAGASIVPGFLGILCGILAYALGANRLGPVAAVLSVVVMFFGVAASQGIVPGFQGTDQSYPSNMTADDPSGESE